MSLGLRWVVVRQEGTGLNIELRDHLVYSNMSSNIEFLLK